MSELVSICPVCAIQPSQRIYSGLDAICQTTPFDALSYSDTPFSRVPTDSATKYLSVIRTQGTRLAYPSKNNHFVDI